MAVGFDNPLYDEINGLEKNDGPVVMEEPLLVAAKRARRTGNYRRTVALVWSRAWRIMALCLLGFALIKVFSVLLSLYIREELMKETIIQLPAFSLDKTSLVDVAEEFRKFKKEFRREWNTPSEHIQRFRNFQQNYGEIKRLNAARRPTNTSYGINDFADWSEDEFKWILLPMDHYKKLHERNTFIRPMNPIFDEAFTDDYPDHFDWREKGVVTPVKAQGQCGSCWAFATVATVESAYAVAHNELRSLSEQELLDCNLENNACNGGDVDKAFRFVYENGLMLEDDYPYVAHRQNVCRLAGETTKIDVAYFINPDEKSIIDWLVNFGPVNVGIAVPPDMKPYKGGLYRPSDYDCKFRVLGLHALLVVGYGTSEEGEKYWIVKNSWGDTWGIEKGYVNFARGVNACGIEDEPIGLLA